MAFSDESDTGSGTDYNDDDVCIVKKDPGFRKVKGQEGMYYKVFASIFNIYIIYTYINIPFYKVGKKVSPT